MSDSRAELVSAQSNLDGHQRAEHQQADRARRSDVHRESLCLPYFPRGLKPALYAAYCLLPTAYRSELYGLVVSPRHAAGPTGLVLCEVVGQPLHDIPPARSLCRLERFALRLHRGDILPDFGRRHRHRFGQLDGPRLTGHERLQYHKRASAVTNTIVGCGGEQAGSRARE